MTDPALQDLSVHPHTAPILATAGAHAAGTVIAMTTRTRRLLAATIVAAALVTTSACSGDAGATSPVSSASSDTSASASASATAPSSPAADADAADKDRESDDAGADAQGNEDEVLDLNPTYAKPKVMPLQRDDLARAASGNLSNTAAQALHREYGTFLANTMMRPEMIGVPRSKLTAAHLAPITAKMTPQGAAALLDNLPKVHAGKEQAFWNIASLTWFDFPKQDNGNRPRVVNIVVKNPRIEYKHGPYGTTLYNYRAEVYGEFPQTDGHGRDVRVPAMNRVVLTLSDETGPWRIDGWSGNWEFDFDPIWEEPAKS